MSVTTTPMERVDGFGLDDKLVVVVRHAAPERMKGGRKALEEERLKSLRQVAMTDRVAKARLVPVSGKPVWYTTDDLAGVLVGE